MAERHHRGLPWKTWAARLFMTVVLPSLGFGGTADAGELAELREDVRAESDSSGSWFSGKPGGATYDEQDDFNPLGELFGEFIGPVAVGVVLSPILAPRYFTGDDGVVDAYFPGYPYRNASDGYLMLDEWKSRPRRWAARLRSEYCADFGDLSRTGGHLLLSTTPRWGLDTEMNFFEERLGDRGRDDLWMGDFNVVYRFAQSERSEWRAGIGFNWLDDPIDTDFGFNFTYGFDFFPVKPFVLSTELDWGTLGSAEAFHFRTTVGVLIRRAEAYIGYEYRDVDRFHFDGLIAGVRLWF
ncbi:MAG TPA: hypothetical protein DD670_09465 [Planctomycetaceae bacterium]|nr:hypothetical protein [Planctomycetaceae bacterium]